MSPVGEDPTLGPRFEFKDLFALEAAFDSGLRHTQELKGWSVFGPLLMASSKGDWDRVYLEAEHLFARNDRRAMVFALQWAVSAAESQYDLHRRAKWLKRWSEIENWATESYCRYLRSYQEGITAIFGGNLREAESRFRTAYELAVEQDYVRGQMRCLFHLGLVFRDRSDSAAAKNYFLRALRLAQDRKASVFGARIEAQLIRLGGRAKSVTGEYRLDLAKFDIEVLIRNREFQAARRAIGIAEHHRRSRKLTRNRESLAIYLALIFLGLGKFEAWQRLSTRLTDPLPRIRMFEIKKTVFGLSDSETFELAALKELHGGSSLVVRSSLELNSVEVCGVALGNIKNEDIRQLIELLLESKLPVKKETICMRLWGLTYDPVTHDGRIYKLFHRARAYFGRADLFLNTYGAYRLNTDVDGGKRRAS